MQEYAHYQNQKFEIVKLYELEDGTYMFELINDQEGLIRVNSSDPLLTITTII